MKVKYAIIDDNPEAMQSLEYYLNTMMIPGLTMEMLHKQYDLRVDSESDHELLTQVDVLFLDIMLKEKNSLDLLPHFKEQKPIVVITTAHETHMLKAIRVSAFDYLLKPIDEDDFKAMLRRLKDRLEKDYNKMREWLSLSNVINTSQLNAEQAKHLQQIKDPIFDAISSTFPQLTLLDKRLLMLIKFGFSSKDIAMHFSIEPDSVKRSKVRLKKRMAIPKDQSIEEALVEI